MQHEGMGFPKQPNVSDLKRDNGQILPFIFGIGVNTKKTLVKLKIIMVNFLLTRYFVTKKCINFKERQMFKLNIEPFYHHKHDQPISDEK